MIVRLNHVDLGLWHDLDVSSQITLLDHDHLAVVHLAALAFAEDPSLANIRGYVEDSGEGRWTVQAAIDEDVPAPVITLSLLMRFASRQDESFSAKVIAALRNQFGGHAVKFESGQLGGVKHEPESGGA